MENLIDVKARKLLLIDKFEEHFDIGGETELNGMEGLLVWGNDGLFYQMSYKTDTSWNITMFPYDIYSKKEWDGEKWVEK